MSEWILHTGITVQNNGKQLVYTAGARAIIPGLLFGGGQTYELAFTVTGALVGTLRVKLGDEVLAITSAGSYVFNIKPGDSQGLEFFLLSGTFVGGVEDITVNGESPTDRISPIPRYRTISKPKITLQSAVAAATGVNNLNQGLAQWFGKQPGETLTGAERRWLLSRPQTTAPKTTEGLWREFLTGLGLFGSLPDMKLEYWLAQ